MKVVPPISRFMFEAPIVVDREATILEAKETMDKYGFRHLPVTHLEKVVGIVSNRDIDLAVALEKKLGALRVRMIMSNRVFAVEGKTPLDNVLNEMTKYKYGAAVVIDKAGKPVGIFTSIDAMNVLSSLVNREPETVELSQCIWPTP